MAQSGLELAPLLTKLKVDISGFKNDMEKAGALGAAEAKKISDKLSGVQKVGEKLSSAGKALTLGVTTPLVGIGTAATKMAIDFEDSFAKVSTIADTSTVSLDQLKSGVLELSKETGFSASGLNEALYQAISASIDTSHAVEFLGVATKAAKGGFTDTETAVNGLTTVLNSYGMEATEAEKIANQMLITQNQGKTSFGELASAMGKVTPVSAALGIKTEELFSSLAVTTAQGLGTAESVTALKAAMSNIIKPSKEAEEAAGKLGISFDVSSVASEGWIGFLQQIREGLKEAAPLYIELQDQSIKNAYAMQQLENAGKENTKEYKELAKSNKELNKEMELMSAGADSTVGGMATMFGSVEALNAVLMLTSETGMNKYSDTMKEMEENQNALNDAYSKMDEAPGERINKLMNELRVSGIQLGEKLLPIAIKGIEHISKITDKIANMSDAQLNNVVKWGAIAAAAGPALSIVGGGIGIFTKLVPIISGVSTALGAAGGVGGLVGALTGAGAAGSAAATAIGAGSGVGLVGSLGALLPVIGPAVLTIGGLATAGYLANKALSEEVVPAVNLFADEVKTTFDEYGNAVSSTTVKISEETKQQVGAYMDTSNEVSKIVHDLYMGLQSGSEETYKTLSEKTNSLADQIIKASEKTRDEKKTKLEEMFKNSTTMTEEEKKAILKTVEDGHKERITKTEGLKKRLGEIQEEIKKNGGKVTKEQQKEINGILETMKEEAIKTMTADKAEQEAILGRLKASKERINTEMMSDAVKKMEEQRKKTIEKAEKEHTERIRIAEEIRAQGGEKAEETANKIIEEANRQYEQTVDRANKMKQEGIDKLEEAYGSMGDTVDRESGEILTWWDKLKKFWDFWKPKPKEFSYENRNFDGNIDLSGKGSGGSKSQNSGSGWSHNSGLDFVPFDGYIATLHKGERVLTASENKNFSAGTTNSFVIHATIREEADAQRLSRQIAKEIENTMRGRGTAYVW